jgi:hypothetical protein
MTVLGVCAVALPMRTGWPASAPSPKKLPAPRIATIASRPVFEITDSLTSPFLTYSTVSQAAPCR